jgi:4-diphosphocytidyl-2-C-methyl-D-erythritol kinase
MPVTLRSYAKINIGLRIGPPGVRGDGFHELRTVYQTIALYDRVTVELRPKSKLPIEIVCSDPRVPTDASNTCWQAAERAVKAIGIRQAVHILIDKLLPVQGGMGAASSNAVAVILGIERAARKRLSPVERLRIAEEVGSDVPLFLVGGTAMGIGRGEQVFPLPDLPEFDMVVCTPPIGVSTPAAFKAWDSLFQTGGLTVPEQSVKLNTFSRDVYGWLFGSPVVSGVSARRGNRAEALLLDLVRTGIENDFERVVFDQFPELGKVKRAIEEAGSVYASLSGSGSTVYGFFKSRLAAERAARKLQKQGIPAVATKTIQRSKLRLF